MGGVTAPVCWGGASQYIAEEYLIGAPPQRAEADTGSNLVWMQCSLCRRAGCFRQNLAPLYNPSRSRTDRPRRGYGDSACAMGFETPCGRDGRTCAVDTRYDGGDIAGVLCTEAFTFQTVSLSFGCITASGLVRGFLNGAPGIIGLDRAALCLVSQLGDTRFSYCLSASRRTSATPYHQPEPPVRRRARRPGRQRRSSGHASVPFAENPRKAPFNTFYLPLVGMSVGNARLAVPAAAFELGDIAVVRGRGVGRGQTFRCA